MNQSRNVIGAVEAGGFMLKRLRLGDWTFSDTAEAVVGILLFASIVVTVLALA
jgi:hypothetical protein